MDYKTTLNLPSTNFPMKANLPQNEPKILDLWQKEDIYRQIRKKYLGRPKYVLHDGPPYANGNIHIGHALNKILKDIIIRFKTMQGFDSPYIPGWDCHGLPVEHQLFKELNLTKEEISKVEFRKKAHNYALKFVNIQKEEFKRLGVFGDWDNPYLTLDKKYEYEIVRALGKLVEKGFIYRGLKPVNWCIICETALAEAEVEYENKSSPSIFVKFRLADNQKFNQDTSLVIWTTTPWTLVSNVAVAVHPDFTYAHLETEQGNLIIADVRLSALSEMGIDKYKVVGTFKGGDLEGLFYEHPFGLRKGRVALADYVATDEGSGLVHIACGHGMEDYIVGLKYNLEIIMPVDEKGNFDKTAGEFKGQNVFSANPAIIEKLKSSGSLLFSSQKEHSYPHCWRCKNPVIFRATKQWFLSIDHNELRKRALGAIENEICFIPKSGRDRIQAMVQLRPDWCISRQRYWGVPIPAVRCLDCNEEILESAVIDNFAKEVANSGSDCWFSQDIKQFLPNNFKCSKCKSDRFSLGSDILDVWFDSGVSHRAALLNNELLEFPASLYLEGSDQHRGWFQASLLPSMAIEDKPPFKAILTHGFVVDGLGRKMSKSIGNVISPQEIIKDYGADILRLWVASSNYSEDVRISKDILLRLTDAYRKIRNTLRFLLGNLYDFSSSKDKLDYDKCLEIDRYNLSCAYTLLKKITKYYEDFDFYKVYQEVYQYCIVQLSNFYLDILKDRLYTFKKDGSHRRSAQTVMYEILLILTKAIAPVLPFTAEEVWQYLNKDEESKSVHLSSWPEIKNKYIDEELENKWYNLIQFRSLVSKAIEEKRSQGELGSSQEAKVEIGITGDNEFLKEFKDILLEIFIVSDVSLEDSQQPSIRASKAKGQKCPRCWNYSQKIGESAKYPDVCPKCISALE